MGNNSRTSALAVAERSAAAGGFQGEAVKLPWGTERPVKTRGPAALRQEGLWRDRVVMVLLAARPGIGPSDIDFACNYVLIPL